MIPSRNHWKVSEKKLWAALQKPDRRRTGSSCWLYYEALGIYVPGACFTGADNGDGTHKVAINTSGSVNGFTPATAPIVLPVNTPGYTSQKPPTQYSYDSISDYMAAGFIYVHAGLRGKDSNSDSYTGNAPWGSPISRRRCATCATTRPRCRARWTRCSCSGTAATAPPSATRSRA